MANEKTAAAPKAAETPPASGAPKKKPMLKMAIMAGIVLALEGGTVGLTMVMAGGPKRVIAEVATPAPAAAPGKDVEIKLIDAKLPNNKSGRLYLYDLQVVATAAEKNKAKVTDLFAEREAEIRDRIRTIIASSDRESLEEPGLETLRRQIGYQLEQDLGKDLIKEVLLPKCTPIRGSIERFGFGFRPPHPLADARGKEADVTETGTREVADGLDAPAGGPAGGKEGRSAETVGNFALPSFSKALGSVPSGAIELLKDVDLNVKIELGRTRMLIEDVLRLAEGSVVELDKLAGDPVDVFVNEQLVARGEVLVLNDNFCVRINEIVTTVEE